MTDLGANIAAETWVFLSKAVQYSTELLSFLSNFEFKMLLMELCYWERASILLSI
jgi:hypothetical protein